MVLTNPLFDLSCGSGTSLLLPLHKKLPNYPLCNAFKFNLRTPLFQMCGVDLTRIDVTTALAVISETGADMSRFASAAHFANWLGLCPGTRITGGRVMSGKTQRVANRGPGPGRSRLAQQPVGPGRVLPAHVRAHGQAQSDHRSGPQAGSADLHDADQGPGAWYEKRYRERVLRNLAQRAEKMGMKLIASEQPA